MDPVALAECEHIFCAQCIRGWEKGTCPLDRSTFLLATLKPAPRAICAQLDELQVKCIHHGDCSQVVSRDQLIAHLADQCEFHHICCPSTGCSATLMRKDLETHLNVHNDNKQRLLWKDLLSSGNVDEVKRLFLAGDLNPNKLWENSDTKVKWTALGYAIIGKIRNKLHMVRLLVDELHVDVDSKCYVSANYKTTPLYAAVEDGNIDIVQILIERGATVDRIEQHDGWTPLGVAIDSGRIDIVRYLLLHHADVRTGFGSSPRWSPLELAIYKSRVDIVRLLIEHHSDVNQTFAHSVKKQKNTPLGYAILMDNIPIARILLDNGASANKEFDHKGFLRCTPLALAISRKNSDMVRLLLDAGAMQNSFVKEETTMTPVSYAKLEGMPEMAALLAERLPRSIRRDELLQFLLLISMWIFFAYELVRGFLVLKDYFE